MDNRLYNLDEGKGLLKIEASKEAENSWVAHVNEVADLTVYLSAIPGI